MKMSQLEHKLISGIQSHINIIYFSFISICGFLLRYSLKNVISGDAAVCLLPWYDTIQQEGGMRALKYQVGNYNFIYQTAIALMTYLPIPPLYAYKCLSGVFDYALATICGFVSYKITLKEDSKKIGLITYTLVLLSPIVILNSSAWAQCDSIYCFFIVAAFIFLCKESYFLSFILLGLSFAFKLQAIFVLPFFLMVWFVRKNFSVINFIFIPVVMMITAIPAIFLGRENAFLDVFRIYIEQTDTYHSLFKSYPSFWCLIVSNVNRDAGYDMFKNFAIVFTVTILACLIFIMITCKVNMNTKNSW